MRFNVVIFMSRYQLNNLERNINNQSVNYCTMIIEHRLTTRLTNHILVGRLELEVLFGAWSLNAILLANHFNLYVYTEYIQ